MSISEPSIQGLKSTIVYIRIEKSNKNIYQKSFLAKAADYWNKLPTEAHLLKRGDKDKIKLKRLILQTHSWGGGGGGGSALSSI